MIFIEYPKCSTCQRAKKWLEENNIDFVDRNIISETPTIFEIQKWLELSGYEIRKFYNTRGVIYRELNLKENLEKLGFDEQLRILTSDAMLIKRPLLITDDNVLIGFKEKEWEECLKK